MTPPDKTRMSSDTRLLRHYPSPWPDTPDLLVCFPHAGAGVSAFAGWPQKLAHVASVALIQLPGRENRLSEPLTQSLHDLSGQIAVELVRSNARRLFLFGHSMGARVAWSVASRLWNDHGVTPVVILSAGSPHTSDTLTDTSSSALHAWFDRMGEHFPAELENTELLALFQNTLAADLAWLRAFPFAPAVALPVDLHCFHGACDGLVTRELMMLWRHYTSAAFTMTEMPGGHLYQMSAQTELLASMQKLIKDQTHA